MRDAFRRLRYDGAAHNAILVAGVHDGLDQLHQQLPTAINLFPFLDHGDMIMALAFEVVVAHVLWIDRLGARTGCDADVRQ